MNRGARLRRARVAAAVSGMAVVVAAASVSFGALRSGDGEGPRPRPVAPSVAAECHDGFLTNATFQFRQDMAESEAEEVARVTERLVGEFGTTVGLTINGRSEAPSSLDVTGGDEETFERILEELDTQITLVTYSSDVTSGDNCETAVRPAVDEERREPADVIPAVDARIRAAECGAAPGYATATHFVDDPEVKWCRFDVTIVNHGRLAVRFPYGEQVLHGGGTAVAPLRSRAEEVPFPARPLFQLPVLAQRGASGSLIFLLPRDAEPTKLELWGSARNSPLLFTIDYDCAPDLRDDADGRCSVGTELREPRYDEQGRVAVSLYHCGVDPVVFAGRQWVAAAPPFDATNAPSNFTGGGVMTVLSDVEATYVDDGGTRIDFQAMEGWQAPPCE